MLAFLRAIKGIIPTVVLASKFSNKTFLNFASGIELRLKLVVAISRRIFETCLKVGFFDCKFSAVDEKFSAFLFTKQIPDNWRRDFMVNETFNLGGKSIVLSDTFSVFCGLCLKVRR